MHCSFFGYQTLLTAARIGILLVAACLGPLAAPAQIDPSVLAPLVISNVEVDARYDNLFAPQKRGFLGADGVSSIQLGDKRILWVFGDTVIGSQQGGKREGPMIHNSIALQDLSAGAPGTITYWWDLPERIPAEPFRPLSPENPHWFWPGCGVAINGKAFLFLTEVGKGAGSDGFAFSTLGCTLFTINNPLDAPEQWQMTQRQLAAANDHFNVNSAALVEDNHVFMLGYHDGSTSKPTDRAAFLCRMPVSALTAEAPGTSLEYWTDAEAWSNKPEQLKALFKPGPTESGLSFDPMRKRYVAATIKPFGNELQIVSAEKLTGPWTAPQTIYRIPQVDEAKKLHAYATRVHPALASGPDELVVSYVINSSDFWSMFTQMDIYYGRFLKVRLGPAAELGKQAP